MTEHKITTPSSTIIVHRFDEGADVQLTHNIIGKSIRVWLDPQALAEFKAALA